MQSFKIICCDWYMSSPISGLDTMNSEFRGSSIQQVPIVRIFGCSSEGVKTCIHIHNVFPYIYIPHDGDTSVDSLIYQIAVGLDKALNTNMGQGSSNMQHVYKIALVSGIPMYGYHERRHQFFKIYFYNPLMLKKACMLLQNANVLNRIYQPHEAHIPYILQFMIDYNLHGMSFINIDKLQYRYDKNLNNYKIPQDLILPLNIIKMSICDWEVDILPENILNVNQKSNSQIATNPGIAALWEDERVLRRNCGISSQISQCLTETRMNINPTKTHFMFKQILTEKLILSSDSEESSICSTQNTSVYPAESHNNENLLEASILDTHVPTNSQNSKSPEEETSFVFGEQDLILLNALNDLKENAKDSEEDSVLSQKPKEFEIESDEDIDLSLPFNLMTPVKINLNPSGNNLDGVDQSNKMDSDDNIEDLDCLDGANDSSGDDLTQECCSPKKKQRKGRLKKELKYTPLKIKTCVSPKKDVSFAKRILSQRSTRKDDLTSKKLDLVKSCTQVEERDENKIALNRTVTEEMLICKLSAKTARSKPLMQNEGSKKDDLEGELLKTLTPDNVRAYDLKSNFKPQACSSKLYETEEVKISRIWKPIINPPSREEVLNSLHKFNIPEVQHEEPFYSKLTDVTGGVEIGNTLLKLCSKSTQDYPCFETIYTGVEHYRKTKLEELYGNGKLTKVQLNNLKVQHCHNDLIVITPAKNPPTKLEAEFWLQQMLTEDQEEVTIIKERKKILIPSSPGMENDDDDSSLTLTPLTPTEERDRTLLQKSEEILDGTPKRERNMRKYVLERNQSASNSYEISAATIDNTHGFKEDTQNYQKNQTMEEQLLTTLIVELHTEVRGNFEPNPELDRIRAIFYLIINDVPNNKYQEEGIITFEKNVDCSNFNDNYKIYYVDDELTMINKFIEFVKKWNPDIFIGYEIEMASWGYLIERGYILNLNMIKELSRILNERVRNNDDGELRITGRILLDFWRLLRHEIALQSYTIENVTFHFLHQRIPKYNKRTLAYWWEHKTNLYNYKTVNYYAIRLICIVKIIEHLDLIGRTSELAKLFGIQFYEVFSRGSQFRVESMMLRLAKPLNFIPVSPNVQQKAKMKAPESLPLILEPESKFYNNPVIVLDFQSLYPSIIIAYNYCFTTCLGKVNRLGKNVPFEFGCTELKIKRKLAKKLLDNDQLLFSPCGVAFVKQEVRRGILPQMLEEILNTRLMVKKSMKRCTDYDKMLKKILHSRQLGLKLIANVTYGYTAANFSGRMAAVEIADSVVSKGRETLERAISLVEKTPEWGARVVYGDTDSLFVMVPGKSKEQAFIIGSQIATAVTEENPSPIKLKLEKVYLPCILQTKKRYVGYMYESPDQKVPVYNAKGIETVRRDGCPAVSKMLEKCLKILFDTKDVSLVKDYVTRQFIKIISGRISIQDLTFAREYRGAAGYRPGACVPALELIKKWKAIDKRNEPRSKERVPYVIVNGPPGLPLIRLVKSPYDLIEDASLRPNSLYYITKVIIPAINRCFNLIGADLNTWFNEMPRKQIQYLPTSSPSIQKKSTISQYFSVTSCACCDKQTQDGLCASCLQNVQKSMVILQDKVKLWEKKLYDIKQICFSCTRSMYDIECVSLDCPIYYRLKQAEKDAQQIDYVRNIIETFR